MCRFVLYLGPEIRVADLVTRPKNSIIHQSFHSHERVEPLNGDGFGLGWYVPELDHRPAVFRSVSPAWNNQNLVNLARVTRSACVLAHVRAATPGFPVVETNCHPFAAGPWSFMHNGHVDGFRGWRRRFLQALSDASFQIIGGNTDSEHVFALLYDRLRELEAADSAAPLGDALEATIHTVLELADEGSGEHLLNLAITDGRRAAVCRFTNGDPKRANTLYLHTGNRYVCDGEECRMLEPDERGSAVLVASEPLSEDPGWQAVPVNHTVLVDADHEVSLRPIDGPRGAAPGLR
jgi:ergothioneine biosynthesis protein EgtC